MGIKTCRRAACNIAVGFARITSISALALVLAVVLWACTARQKGPEAPSAGQRWVESVSIDGNSVFSDREILRGLVTHKPHGLVVQRRVRYDAALVATDRRRIESFYKLRGFFDVSVLDVQIKERKGLATQIRFVISEGQASSVGAIDVVGLPPEARAIVLGKIGVRIGERFDYERYDKGKEAIISLLRDKGYAHAALKATALASRSSRRVVLRYEVAPGPMVQIGEIAIRGLTTIPESAVRNRLTFASGDRFSNKAINTSRDQLRSLGRFGVIRIDFADDAHAEVSDIIVTVSEGPRHEVRLGGGSAFDGGLSTDNSQWLVRARAGYRVLGFIDPLTTLDTELRPGVTIQSSGSVGGSFVGEAKVGLTREDLWLPRLGGNTQLSYNILAFDNFRTHGPRLGLGLHVALWHQRIKIGVGWQGEILCFSNSPALLDPSAAATGEYEAAIAEPLGLDRTCSASGFPTGSSYRLAYFEESIALEGRDSVIDTRSGYYVEARFEQAGPMAGSEFAYVTMTPEARVYLSPTPRVVLGARVRYGRALSGDLPITRRYFAGGASSQRGFGQRQLAPVAGDLETSNIEIGGNELLEATIEARIELFPLWGTPLGLAVFTDAADVALEAGDVQPTNLHIAPGLGLRYHTPIGPFRFDVGYRATRQGIGQIHASDSLAYHISIGEAF